MDLEVLSPWMWVATTTVVLAVTVIVFGRITEKTQVAKLPDGSWSLPFVGESLQLMRQGFRQFLIDHFARYGDPFRMSLFGRPIIVMNTSESIKYVLSTTQKSFASSYPVNFTTLTGRSKFSAPQYHSHVRKLALATFTGSNLRNSLSFINSKALETVNSWESMGTVNLCDEMTKFTFSVMMHFVWEDMTSSSEVENIRSELGCLTQGLMAMRINFPTFRWYRALKAREALVARIGRSLANRRKEGSHYEDFFGGLMEMECNIAEDDMCSVMVTVMFAGFTTTAVLIPWTIKYLHDYPTVRESIQAEQDGIRERMITDDFLESFSMKECMPLTSQVILICYSAFLVGRALYVRNKQLVTECCCCNVYVLTLDGASHGKNSQLQQVVDEVLRIQSIAPVIPRRALETVEYKGTVIPKDSLVWVSTCSLHMDPDLFPDPTMFHSSRFETPPKPNTFLPFGSGPHLCPGSDIAKTETVFVVHHLLTNYRICELEAPSLVEGHSIGYVNGFDLPKKILQCHAEK